MSDSTATGPPFQSTPSRRIPCKAGVRLHGDNRIALWVRSPKTGREISVHDGWFPELRSRAPRLIGRIAQARSVGKSVVEIAIDELKVLADIAQIVAVACNSRPRTLGIYSHRIPRKGKRRRGW